MAFINQGWHVGTSTRLDPGTFGGTESFYSTFKIHTFLTSDVFTYIGSGDIQVDILKVAGGGGGGGNGGGGAGGMVVESNFTISPGEYNFIVGAGGVGAELINQLRFRDFPRAGTVLVVTILMVLIVDTISAAIRRRIIKGREIIV